MKTRYLAILATLALLGFSVPAAAHECSRHGEGSTHKHCADPAPEPSGGGKALLFEINFGDVQTCGGATANGPSFGQVSWAGNVLWDPNNIHAHLKLQLKDVDPGTYGPILGGNGIECVDGVDDDIPLCADNVCDLKITVKQNRQGRMSGALRLPGHNQNDPTAVWVTVTVDDGDGGEKILRSAPVTVVLPPNEVGTGTSCPPK